MTRRQVVDVRAESAASPEDVWSLLADVRTWTKWTDFDHAAYDREGSPPPHGVGAVRSLRVGRLQSRDTVLAFEPPLRLSYDYAGWLPITQYRADVTLCPLGSGGTHITWHAAFNGRRPLAGPIVRLFLKRVLRRLAAQLATAAEAEPSVRSAWSAP